MKLNIKGRFKTLLANMFLKNKIRAAGVDLHELKSTHPEMIELVISGNKENLWGALKLVKNQNLFMELNEVVFEFVD